MQPEAGRTSRQLTGTSDNRQVVTVPLLCLSLQATTDKHSHKLSHKHSRAG
jgi:hypothetical protein